MDHESRYTPRLLALAALMAAGMLTGCEGGDSGEYDPRIDGVVPHRVAMAEPGILDNQNNFHKPITPAPAPRSPGRTPETATRGGTTPPPPEMVAPPPPPPEDGAPASRTAPEPAAPAPGG